MVHLRFVHRLSAIDNVEITGKIIGIGKIGAFDALAVVYPVFLDRFLGTLTKPPVEKGTGTFCSEDSAK
jgi:hypothetical protein